MIKCGGGDDGLYEDRKFQQNIQGALANGIQVGVYFYSGASNAREAYDEASYCISLIRDYQITYPVAFDWELDGDYDSVTEACETFCNVISSYGYQPMVYSNRNRWYNNFDGEKIASKYKVWMAAYFGKFYYDSVRWTYGDDLPNFRYHYDMWQYSSRCYVDGISGQVDVDIAFFGYANYHVDTKDAVLTVTNKEIKRTYGDGIGRLTEELNLLDGVKGINTIGYDMDIEYSIYDESGNEYSEEEAISTAGKYTVEYRFKDPKSGWIKNTAKLEIEVITMPGKGEFKLTGNMGDVMKESASIAVSYIRSVTEKGRYKVDAEYFHNHAFHLHIPEGATPKDGPSAGVTMATAVLSAVTGIPVRADVAMTGELTLRGKVLPIGGLKEKLLASKTAGITNVFVPQDNRSDVEELDAEITEGMNIIYVNTAMDVFNQALMR